MTSEQVLQELHPIFQKVFSDPGLQVIREMSAKDVKRWDSLTHLNMIHEVETYFGVRFKLKELTGMKNVGDMVDLIVSKKS
jgi:acyl carrier protein